MKHLAILFLAILVVSFIATFGDAATIDASNKKSSSNNEQSSAQSSSSSSNSSNSHSSSKSVVEVDSDGKRQEKSEKENEDNAESSNNQESSSNSVKNTSNNEEQNVNVKVNNPVVVVARKPNPNKQQSDPQISVRSTQPNPQITLQQSANIFLATINHLSELYSGIEQLQIDILDTQQSTQELNEVIGQAMSAILSSLNNLVNSINDLIEDTNKMADGFNYIANQTVNQ